MLKRLAHIDLTRGFAVLAMFAVHVLQTLGDKHETRKTLYGKVIEFFGGAPAAPTFMFLMGLGLAYSGKSPLSQAKRGLLLLILGYALNFARASAPILAGAPYPGDPWEFFWMVDILQFAGAALILSPLLVRLPTIALGGLFLAVAFLSPYLWGLTPDAHALVDILWGKHPRVYFPVFPWLAFPLSGMLYARLRDTRPARSFWVVGVLLIAAGWPLHNAFYGEADFYSYYHATPGSVLWMTGFALLWLEAARWLTPRLAPAMGFFRFWSVNVTPAYVISWILIVWSTFLVGYRSLGKLHTSLAIMAVTLLTALFIFAYNQLKSLAFDRYKKSAKGPQNLSR